MVVPGAMPLSDVSRRALCRKSATDPAGASFRDVLSDHRGLFHRNSIMQKAESYISFQVARSDL